MTQINLNIYKYKGVKMKLYMNSDKLNSIENNKLRAIYKDIKEKLILYGYNQFRKH